MSDTPDIAGGDNSARVAAAELKGFAERIARLEEERKAVSDEIKDVKAEAKAKGYSTAALNKVLSIGKMKEEDQVLVHLYGEHLGVFG